jgi:hypothetical protein
MNPRNPLNYQKLVDKMRVSTPCQVPWQSMTGDEKVRFCGQCRLSVYNIAEMTAKEAVDLVREKEGKLCVRLYVRPDGTVLSSDCPVAVRALKKANRILLKWLGALMAGLFSTPAQAEPACTVPQLVFEPLEQHEYIPQYIETSIFLGGQLDLDSWIAAISPMNVEIDTFNLWPPTTNIIRLQTEQRQRLYALLKNQQPGSFRRILVKPTSTFLDRSLLLDYKVIWR